MTDRGDGVMRGVGFGVHASTDASNNPELAPELAGAPLAHDGESSPGLEGAHELDTPSFEPVRAAFAELGVEASIRKVDRPADVTLRSTGARSSSRIADALRARGITVEEIDVGGTSKPLELERLDMLEDRSVAELMRDGDQDGARVVVLATGARGTIRCSNVIRGVRNELVGHTRLTVELPGERAPLPFNPDELAPYTEVRVKSTGELGIAWREAGEWAFLRDGCEPGSEWPIPRELLEPAAIVNAISSIRVEHGPAHDRIAIWNRGAHAGELVVQRGDGTTITSALCEVAARAMCSGRLAAIRALTTAGDDMRAAVVRLGDVVPLELDEAVRRELLDLIVSLGDAAIAADVAARNVEKEISK